jgi:hypothetical protein
MEATPVRVTNIARALFLVQGLYFLATGIWPLVHLQSFLMVTGPKTDLWLVQTVGAVLAVIGTSLCVAGMQGWRDPAGPSSWVLAIGSAAALAAVDLLFTAERIIAPVYLVDAAAEVALLIAWGTLGYFWWKSTRRPMAGHLAAAWR